MMQKPLLNEHHYLYIKTNYRKDNLEGNIYLKEDERSIFKKFTRRPMNSHNIILPLLDS